MRRFEQFQALLREAADLRQALEDRKVIERAKGVLMKKAGLDEHDAFRRLQKLASDKNRKLVDIAQMILTADQASKTRPGEQQDLRAPSKRGQTPLNSGGLTPFVGERQKKAYPGQRRARNAVFLSPGRDGR